MSRVFERSGTRGEASHERAVVYVADPGFLIPSIVSAEQVYRQISDIADVIVALIGFSEREFDSVSQLIAGLGLYPLRLPEFGLPEGTHWNEGHVPLSTLGRLMLPGHLDGRYRHVIYIDGDTQITGDVRPLVMLNVPEGRIAAAPDFAWLEMREFKFPKGYLEGLGVGEPESYFNAGVLALGRGTFDRIMPDALAFFLKNSKLCKHHDQSALNALVHDRRFTLSPRYNFTSDYWAIDPERVSDPVIMHFSGPGKPWKSNSRSFAEFGQVYRELVRRFPELSVYGEQEISTASGVPKDKLARRPAPISERLYWKTVGGLAHRTATKYRRHRLLRAIRNKIFDLN